MSQVSDNVTGPSLSAVAVVPCDATSAGGQGLVRMTNDDDISALHVSDSDTIMPIAGVTHTDKNFYLSVENYLKSNYDKWWSNSMVKWHSGPKDLSGCTRCQTNQVFDNWTSTRVSHRYFKIQALVDVLKSCSDRCKQTFCQSPAAMLCPYWTTLESRQNQVLKYTFHVKSSISPGRCKMILGIFPRSWI